MVKVFGALSSFWKRRDCNDDCQRENGYMKAVILAGGLGTRISEETGDKYRPNLALIPPGL